jgi:chloride channel 7
MRTPVSVFREVEKVGRIMEILQKTKHNGYPVVDGYDPSIENSEKFGLLKGLILKNQLLTLIKKKCYAHTDIKLEPRDFRESYPRFIDISILQHVSDEEKEFEIDLRPYMNLSPYSLTENSNLPRVFRLFRGLGLRHLVIVDLHNNVVGIVTRIDIARYRAHVGLKSFKIVELNVAD